MWLQCDVEHKGNDGLHITRKGKNGSQHEIAHQAWSMRVMSAFLVGRDSGVTGVSSSTSSFCVSCSFSMAASLAPRPGLTCTRQAKRHDSVHDVPEILREFVCQATERPPPPLTSLSQATPQPQTLTSV